MGIALYILYAFAQGVFTARAIDDRTAPVFMVVLCMIFAPVVSLLWILAGFSEAVKFLVTYGKK